MSACVFASPRCGTYASTSNRRYSFVVIWAVARNSTPGIESAVESSTPRAWPAPWRIPRKTALTWSLPSPITVRLERSGKLRSRIFTSRTIEASLLCVGSAVGEGSAVGDACGVGVGVWANVACASEATKTAIRAVPVNLFFMPLPRRFFFDATTM
ncbi:MAG: hypothetical protein LC785_18010 [Acidobacteria bacterium]|nr:hypothetical protein [Acidobacteriota bacterium]